MNKPFEIEIGFIEEDSSDSSILTIGGTIVDGDIYKGAEGSVQIDGMSLQMKVKDVAFLKGTEPGSIMFSVLKPEAFSASHNWVGARFVGV